MKQLNNVLRLISTNKIANRFVKIFSVDALVKGSVFLLLPLYLRLMNQSEVGTFNYLFTFVQTLTGLLCFGLTTPQSKLYFDYQGQERGQLLFSINLILIIFLTVLLVPLYYFRLDFKIIEFLFDQPIPYHKYRFVLLLAILVSVGSSVLFNYLLTSENIKKVQRYNLLRLLIDNSVVIAILYFSDGDKVFSRLTTYYLCEAFLLLCFVPAYIKQFVFGFNFSLIKRIFSLSLPMFVTVIISTIYTFSDKFFIQQKTDMNVLATYTTGIMIASVCSLIITSFQSIWLPIFFQEKDLEQNIRKTKKMIKIIVVVFTAIALMMIAAVKAALIFNVIPIEYENVLIILPFLFLSQIILAVNAMWSNYFAYFERLILGAITGGSVYVLGFILNLLLIPHYGVPGAIVALLTGNVILVTAVYLQIKKLINNKLQQRA